MFIKRFISVVAVVAYLNGTLMAQDPEWFNWRKKEKESRKPASTVTTIAHGIGMGAYTGLAAGWVRYEDRSGMQNVWDSVGYGALAGLGAGLTAAIAGRDGAGDEALTDMDILSGAGGGIGFFWGIVSALFTGDSRRVGSGMGWGHLGGLVAGMGLAGYQIAAGGYPAMQERDTKTSVRFRTDSGGNDYPAFTVEKKF